MNLFADRESLSLEGYDHDALHRLLDVFCLGMKSERVFGMEAIRRSDGKRVVLFCVIVKQDGDDMRSIPVFELADGALDGTGCLNYITDPRFEAVKNEP